MARYTFDVNDAAVRETFLRRELFDALGALREDTAARWGGMTARQMAEHLVWTFEVSAGLVEVDCPYPEPKRERLKPFLYQNTPTPPGFRNPVLESGLPALRYAGLPETLVVLREAVDRFFEVCGQRPELRPMHPVFGPIGMEDWSRTHFKHAHHHLLQFGLIDPE